MFSIPTGRRGRMLGASTAAAVAAALAVTGCAGGGSSPQAGASPSNCFLSGTNSSSDGVNAKITSPVTITFMETMIGGAQKPAIQHLTDEFHAANPNITVTLEGAPNYNTLQQNEKDAVAAKKAPTIGQAYEGTVADFANSGVIDPLNGYVGNSAAQLYQGVQNDLKLCDGNTWMWPFSKSVYVNFYNPTMLKAANLTEPATWDQYAANAKAVSNNGVTGISIDPGGAGDISSGVVWLEILAQANGTPVFDKDGQPQFNSPAAVKAMQYLADLKRSGALATGKGYPGETALGAGKGLDDISSVAGYSYEQQAVGNRFPLATSDLPTGPSGKANQMNGGNLVIFSQASAEQKAAAWKYLQFLSSASSQAYWSTQTGYVPVTPQALSQMTAFTSANPWMITAANALQDSSGSVPAPWGDKTQYELGIALSSVLQSGVDPKVALDKAQTNAKQEVKAAQ
ncbi:MAG TPA: extracellular solute-binding protein [Pseudonocardiaceae bacterium]|jgi:multiple sugar transport system substrate-binding protein|nr:extracellular solute-binding protein [Pseudonocardiaceae bacterium]